MGENGDAHGPIREPYLDEEIVLAKTQQTVCRSDADTVADARGCAPGPCCASY